MALERFKAASIATLDGGRIGVALDQAFARAREDCIDRPGVEKGRTVTLEIVITPVCDEKGLDSCTVEFSVKERMPARESKVYSMRATPSDLLFNELSADDINQVTIDQGARFPGTKEKANAR
ncbi:MAG: hypothetical protein EPN91_05295 [Salinibacterium sp.]|nr:MAG: hypothetical protein EPN91_05295 [Salinibacterium sp.]